MSNTRTWVISGLLAAIALIGCGDKGTTPEGASSTPTATTTGEAKPAAGSTISIDGSTTVFPIVSVLAEDFKKENAGVDLVVNKAGTGSGFKKFAEGNLDIATASRPIKDDEIKTLTEKKIEFIEIPVAYDGVSVIVNPGNTWAKNVTVEELKKAWSKDSTITTWDQINPSFPKEKVTFFGPTDNHGTYEYFTEAINGKKNEIRKEYQPNQEYTAIVTAVGGEKGAIAFVGYNYYIENKDKVTALTVGGVAPTEATIADGTYTPLSRPLFIYVNKKSLERPEVKKFVEFALGEAGNTAVKDSSYVQLPQDVRDAIKAHFEASESGTKMKDFKPGQNLTDVYGKK
jgi:phosphate transport system substrate-binding protein